ncbi:sulfatase-containing protein [Macrophomina phaseolina]|uniref:Sulfatase-containing protein n=1 Tax=Macrophomina phaseolina TaxID=35725 RepID=A0ABQ8GUY5_9PEZI|nr:sulfatase-containing protein [Macrophomina phaseolina]
MAFNTVLVLQIVRPRNPPYAHMSGSLPITLFESLFFSPINADFCLPHAPHHVEFPFEEYVKASGYAPPPGWKPFTEECLDAGLFSTPHHDDFDTNARSHASASGNDPRYNSSKGERPADYNPACDPLKLSNLNSSLLEPLMDVIKTEKPRINHVLFVTLESTRKDMFPFKKDSNAYNSILSTYGSSATDVMDELNEKLRNLTRTAAFLTGEPSGFENSQASNTTQYLGPWASQFHTGHGGINVQHAMTGSAFTLKSLITSHCGIDPLPVDFTEEVRGRMYQPCFPHVLGLFNKANQDASTGKNTQARTWDAALVQSITDQWDSQYTLDEQMGFPAENIILDTTLEDEKAAHYPPKEPRCNYFGYPETESLPYLRDMFVDAKKNNRRLWASHITSTTHHPYSVPESWTGQQDYVAKRRFAGLESEEFDRYLNTIKYQDQYLDTLMTMLHDIRVLNETLVVLVGDHGLAFTTPDGSKSTFENGHVSNFAIPLVFVHPALPRIQVDAQTTPTSILPTVLDMLLQTNSLGAPEERIAQGLLPRYQGQSMIRAQSWSVPVAAAPARDLAYRNVSGPQPFHFSVINPGGSLLAIAQHASRYRLMLPLCSALPLRFTDLSASPHETEELVAWSAKGVVDAVRKRHGDAAAEWVDLAQKLGEWWVWETRRRWGYELPARSTDRGASGTGAAGRIKKAHWWET